MTDGSSLLSDIIFHGDPIGITCTNIYRLPDAVSTEIRELFRIRMAEAFHALTQAFGGRWDVNDVYPMPDVGPTTACWTCDAIVRIQDSYSPKKDDRPFEQRQSLCEDCFAALEAKGVAHVG